MKLLIKFKASTSHSSKIKELFPFKKIIILIFKFIKSFGIKKLISDFLNFGKIFKLKINSFFSFIFIICFIFKILLTFPSFSFLLKIANSFLFNKIYNIKY